MALGVPYYERAIKCCGEVLGRQFQPILWSYEMDWSGLDGVFICNFTYLWISELWAWYWYKQLNRWMLLQYLTLLCCYYNSVYFVLKRGERRRRAWKWNYLPVLGSLATEQIVSLPGETINKQYYTNNLAMAIRVSYITTLCTLIDACKTRVSHVLHIPIRTRHVKIWLLVSHQ